MFKLGLILERSAFRENGRFFGASKVYVDTPTSCQYIIQSISGLKAVVNHFESYPLMTKKRADFELFRQAFYLVSAKEHLTKESFQRYINLRASINKGKPFQYLLAEYPDTVQLVKPSFELKDISDPL